MVPNHSSPSLPDTSADIDESRLTAAMEEYLSALESGQAIDRETFLKKHADLSPHLSTALESLDFVHGFAAGQDDSPDGSLPSSPERETSIGGEELGDYRLVRELGRGGMGVVYEAEERTLGRRIALKVLPFAALLDQRRLARFHNEARAAAMVKHPHIVSVYSVGCQRGIYYYAMELIEGMSLAEVIDRRESPAADLPQTTDHDTAPIAALSTQSTTDRKPFYRTVARLGVQAAEALHYAHQEGIIHRDIKPSNLLLDKGGNLHIADFGLARIHAGDDLTLTGDMPGTLRYMSPEQVAGDQVVDQRSDIYALGITLYELVVGRPAFAGNNREQLLRRVLNDPLSPPRKIEPGIPRDLETIIQKAAAKTPEGRYRSAEEMSEDLRRFVESKPVKARRVGRTELLRLWARRNPAIAGLVAIVACLLLALAAGGTAFGVHALRVTQRENVMAAETATRWYVSEIRRAQTLTEQGDVSASEEILLRHVPESMDSGADRRGFEWFYLWDQCHRSAPVRIFRHSLPGATVAYQPDGNTLVTGLWSGSLHVWNPTTGEKLFPMHGASQHGQRVVGLGFVENGSEIVSVTGDGTIGRWDLVARQNRWFAPIFESEAPYDAAVASKKKLLAVSCANPSRVYDPNTFGAVVVWDIESRQPIARFDEIPGCPMVAFSPEEDLLIMSGFDGAVRVAETSTWSINDSFPAHSAPIHSLAFASDGKTLATGSENRHGQVVGGEIRLWDTDTWEPRETLHVHAGFVRCLAFSQDGSRMVSGSDDGTLALWSVAKDKPATLTTTFRGHSYSVKDVAFSPDGEEFSSISGDSTCRSWNCDQVENRVLGPTSFGEEKQTKVTLALADGDTAVCVSSWLSDLIQVRDVDSGEVRFDVRFENATFTDLAVSPDQNLLAVAGGFYPMRRDRPGDFRLYDIATGDELRRFGTSHPFTCRGITFSADGRLLIAACWNRLVVWDVDSGDQVTEFGPVGGMVKCLSVRPGHALVACGTTTGIVHFFDLSTLRSAGEHQMEGATIEGLDFSPDGRYLATGGVERRAKLWDADTLELVRLFRKTGNWVMHVQFSPDGRRLLTGGMDGTLHLSEVTTGEHLLRLPVEQAWICNGQFSRDGSFIAAAGRRVHLWRCDDQWRELLQLSVDSLPPICPD